MSANPSPYRRVRVILDCILVVLVILIAGANFLSGQARPEPNLTKPGGLVSSGPPLSRLDLESPPPAPASPALDNNTLAAVIAAENAALTPPIHFLDLPLVVH
jgi:hypothetical protein